MAKKTSIVSKPSKQANQFDKIFRENMEVVLPGLIRHLLHIDAVHAEELPDDVQHTRERKPDVLKKVTDRGGGTFVLQIEIQVKDEQDMVLRMAEYFIMLYRRYRLPVWQYVIYVGESIPVMPEQIKLEQLDFRYKLITLSAIDYRLFLRGRNPEEKLLAILANFGNEDPQEIIRNIVQQVAESAKGDLSRQRYLEQLRILSQLRKLALEKLEKIMEDNIAQYFSVEKDILYILGIKKGIERGMEKGAEKKSLEVVRNLLASGKFSVSEIANLASVPEAFVRKAKRSLK